MQTTIKALSEACRYACVVFWVDADDDRSDMFNILENLNDKILIKNLNISKSAEFSNFVEKNKLHFAEKLFDFKCKIYWMLTVN